MYKVGVVRFADLIRPIKMKYFGLSKTKLFHFHGIFKNEGWGGGSSEPPGPPLDPPLESVT